MRTDRETDMRKLSAAIRNFANAPKNYIYFHVTRFMIPHNSTSPDLSVFLHVSLILFLVD